MTDLTKAVWRIGLLGGITTVAIGVMLLVWPDATLQVVAVLFGIQLVFWGIMLIAGSVVFAERGGIMALGLIGGVLCILGGIVAFRAPARTIVLLAIYLGAAWLITGILQSVEAIVDRHETGWGWTLASGVVSLLAGLAVMSFPIASVSVLALWAGVFMVVMGALRIWLSWSFRESVS